MSRPAIQSIKLSKHLTLSECHPDSECRTVNWWLYDERAGMNLSMRASTKESALQEALDYWAKRCLAVENAHASLSARVDAFVAQVRPVADDADEDR
jgi:hypothetical protein